MHRVFKVSVNGTAYDVVVEELTSSSSQFMPSYMGSAPAVLATQTPVVAAATLASANPTAMATAPVGSGDHCAQMGGVVATILVKEGQSVNSGERLLELEAMKMKVPLMANRTGTVSRILVEVGAAVLAGQPLVVIE